MKHTLRLVRLSDAQIAEAKATNGARKQISHALLCGPFGQIVGTEKQTRKYFDVWKSIFPAIFENHEDTDDFEISKYESTFNLVNILIAENDRREAEAAPNQTQVKRGLFSRFFG